MSSSAQGLGPSGDQSGKSMDNHKFWSTQPVPKYSDTSDAGDGPIQEGDPAKVPQEPYPLKLDGFEWVTMDIDDQKEVDDIYKLLFDNYVEDDEAMFRFKYSASFLNWALKSPGWRKDWHIGVRTTNAARRLVAFISAVPLTMRIRSTEVKASEVNFLCVHKKLRSHRLAPMLIKEITRRCNVQGIWQAIYTAGVELPVPISSCRYYHRALDWQKLYEVGFSPLPPGSTISRQVIRNKLPDRTSTIGLRPMEKKDVGAVGSLLRRYLEKQLLTQQFTDEEIEHWLLPSDPSSTEKVVWAYVVELGGKITDFFSFYLVESSAMANTKHSSIKVAYLYYYATEAALQDDSDDKSALKKRLNILIKDALILAKKENFDVFNALTLLDNPLFLKEQLFGPGDGRLHYYLFNYRTAPLPSGTNQKGEADEKYMRGVGLVML